jgi:hypothetical protein
MTKGKILFHAELAVNSLVDNSLAQALSGPARGEAKIWVAAVWFEFALVS